MLLRPKDGALTPPGFDEPPGLLSGASGVDNSSPRLRKQAVRRFAADACRGLEAIARIKQTVRKARVCSDFAWSMLILNTCRLSSITDRRHTYRPEVACNKNIFS